MNLDVNFFSIEYNGLVPKQGRILISEPFSEDHFFSRSIVLITEHDENGTLGFILNKPIEMQLDELLADLPYSDLSVSLGGPVNTDRIYFLHTLGEKIPNSIKILENIYWGGDFVTIKSLLKASVINPSQIRFFLGYSGWQPNQLISELKNNYWLVSDIDTNLIMNSPDELWEKTLSNMDDKYKTWAFFPENPTYN